MCFNDPRSSASTSLHGHDVQQAGDFESACSPSLVDAFRHASITRSVRRSAVAVEDLWWRLKEHILVEEMLCTDCISRGSGVPFI